jgi:putative transposase
LECEIIELEVTPALACGASVPDHVHILCEVDPRFGVHKFVKRVKGLSSFLLRKQFPTLKSRLPTLWTNSYFISTVGGAPLAVIKQYIENQKSV